VICSKQLLNLRERRARRMKAHACLRAHENHARRMLSMPCTVLRPHWRMCFRVCVKRNDKDQCLQAQAGASPLARPQLGDRQASRGLPTSNKII
jgi:hypothetical protein